MSLLISSGSLLHPPIPNWLEDLCDKLRNNKPSIRTIYLTHPRIDAVYAKVFANALDENHSARCLILSCHSIVDDGACAVGSVVGKSVFLEKLQWKDLRNAREINLFFQQLQQNKSFKEVSLQNCAFVNKGYPLLKNFFPNTHVYRKSK